LKRVIGYLGSKVKLHDFIKKIILKDIKEKKVFVDLFAGTCSVGKLVQNETNLDIISNDIAKYSKILFSELEIFTKLTLEEQNKIKKKLLYLNNLKIDKNKESGIFFNEFSMEGNPQTITNNDIFDVKKKIKDDKGNIIEIKENRQPIGSKTSRMFFKSEVGKKIDLIKDYLKDNDDITKEEESIILLFLLNFADKNSNTTSVFGAYLKEDKLKRIKPFFDEDLFEYLKLKSKEEKIKTKNKRKFTHYVNFAEKTLDIIKKNTNITKEKTIIYIDPPYSTRSYESNYHILEYLIDLDFNPIKTIKENSKSGTKKEKSNNPFVSKQKTFDIFKEIIYKSLEVSNDVYISYSTDKTSLMKQSDIVSILMDINQKENRQIKLNTYFQDYKRFTSGENGGINNNEKNKISEVIWHISEGR